MFGFPQTMTTVGRGVWLKILLLSLSLGGCSSTISLMPTPNIYLQDGGYPDSDIPSELQNNRIELLFVTDRQPETLDDGVLQYGTRRSASTGFGSVFVEIGVDTSWEELVEFSETSNRKSSPPIRIVSRTEIDRFPATPHAFLVVDGEVQEDPRVQADYDRVAAIFHKEVNRKMAETGHNEVHIFIHGFHTPFDEAAAYLADYWHFIGRRGVPLLYTWPADHKGIFGYFVDRESGEFTIYHLKNLIRLLSTFPEVEKIHILAHSRGTDVATTALRELIIEARAAGFSPRKYYRIENLILAAPDLDFDIVRQRLIAEKIGPAFGKITVYTNNTDKALGLSETLMAGTRFGRISTSDLGESEMAVFSVVKNVAFINVQNFRSFAGHGYFLYSPATSSDIIQIIRTGSEPGSTDRPLIHEMLNFWHMPSHYPNELAGYEVNLLEERYPSENH